MTLTTVTIMSKNKRRGTWLPGAASLQLGLPCPAATAQAPCG